MTAVDAIARPVAGGRPDRASPGRDARRRTAGRLARVGLVAIVVALWWSSLRTVDVDAMSDIGLVSVLPVQYFAALAMLGASFAWCLARRTTDRTLAAIHVAVLALMVHGTPAVLYDHPRYAWSYKHLGIVDYISRHDAVDPSIRSLDVYHNWPGFFAGSSLLSDATGIDAFTLARWAPLAFGTASAFAVAALFHSMRAHPKAIWAGAWISVLANWVGQEYFSPQAVTFVLFLVVLAVTVPVFRMGAYEERWDLRGRLLGPSARATTVGLILAIAGAIAVSHQLTPLALVAFLGVFALLGRVRSWRLAVLVAVATVGWIVLGAQSFVERSLTDQVADAAAPFSNSTSGLVDTARISAGSALVAGAARALSAVIVLAAGIGLVRRIASRQWWVALAALVVTPLTMVLFSSYDGEIQFRVYLFMVPFLSLAAAYAIVPTRTDHGWRVAAGTLALTLAATPLLLLAYDGKEQYNHFTDDEVAAARSIYATAPPGSLVVEGSRNYPGLFLRYEDFVTVPISREPGATAARIARDPVGVIGSWLSDGPAPAAYLIITRSQKREQEALRDLPEGFLDDLEAALRASPEFVAVFDRPDAVVFVAAGQAERGPG